MVVIIQNLAQFLRLDDMGLRQVVVVSAQANQIFETIVSASANGLYVMGVDPFYTAPILAKKTNQAGAISISRSYPGVVVNFAPDFERWLCATMALCAWVY
jgi:hypothetical protein